MCIHMYIYTYRYITIWHRLATIWHHLAPFGTGQVEKEMKRAYTPAEADLYHK